MPFRRRYERIALLLYPLSPTSRWGRCLGRPRPARLTAPPSISSSKATVSCRWPGVNRITIGLPFPSARMWTLVLNPPRLRPSASVSGSPLLHPQRAGVLARWSHPRSVLPSPVGFPRQPLLGLRRIPCPKYQPSASDRIDSLPSTRNHIAQEGLSMGLPSAIPTVCHSGRVDDLPTAAPYSVSVVVATVPNASTVCQSSLLCSFHQFTDRPATLQTRPRPSDEDKAEAAERLVGR